MKTSSSRTILRISVCILALLLTVIGLVFYGKMHGKEEEGLPSDREELRRGKIAFFSWITIPQPGISPSPRNRATPRRNTGSDFAASPATG